MRLAAPVPVAAALLLVFVLAGCVDDDTPAGDDAARGFAASEATGAPAETPPPAPTATLTAEDEMFLAYVQKETPDFTATALPEMSNTDKITAGHEACDALLGGADSETLRLVPGEVQTDMGYFMDTAAIITGARYSYCPETIESVN